jgi:hypothetical protein
MWKSILLTIVAVPLSIFMAVIAGLSLNWKAGAIAGSSTMAICMVIATLMLFFLKTFSLVDVFLPLLFSVVWSVILIPFSFGEAIFSAPAAIGSGFILTLCLWRVHQNGGAGKSWLIFPIIVYMYEMLPVNIPGPFDDYFAFGGDVVCGILFYSSASFNKQLPRSSTQLRD